MKISVVLITLNEEINIQRCLSSLSFANEIIVVDGGSNDRTVEFSNFFKAQVFKRDFDDFASQKNYAIEKASGDWVFSIDADECVSQKLADEIQKTVDAQHSLSAYSVRRKTRLFGRVFCFSGLQSDRPIRLFRKGKASFEGIVHEVLKVEGSTGSLKEPLEHNSFQTLHSYWRRLEIYTSLEARKDAVTPTSSKLLSKPFLRFLSIYGLKQGFRDGIEGFIYAVLSSYYEFVRWAKIWEKKEGKV